MQTPQVTLDVTAFGPVIPPKEGRRVSIPRKSSQMSPSQQSLLRAAVNGPTASVIPSADLIRKAFSLVDAATADINVRSVIGFPPALYAHDVTIGIGFDVTAAAVVTISAGGGLYFSTLPDVGIYASVGGGLTSNASFFAGGAVTVVFGPPSTFNGDAYAIGADYSFPPPAVVGVGGALLFAVDPPYHWIGYVVQYGLSPSVLPWDMTIQISRTTTSSFLRTA